MDIRLLVGIVSFFILKLALKVIFIVYLWVYAVSNPVMLAWFYVFDSLKYSSIYKECVTGQSAGANGLVEMHNRFVVWFKWGYYNILIISLISYTSPHPSAKSAPEMEYSWASL